MARSLSNDSIYGMVGILTVTLLGLGRPTALVAQPMPQPSQEHALLKRDVGTWDAAIKVRHEPGAAPTESKGSETNEMLGQMWLATRFESDFAGMPFIGSGVFGYDPIEKKYVGTWIDSMTPHLTTMQGDYDHETKSLTMMALGRDPATGEMQKSKHVSRHIDDDTRTLEIHVLGDDGEYWKMLEIRYTRRAE